MFSLFHKHTVTQIVETLEFISIFWCIYFGAAPSQLYLRFLTEERHLGELQILRPSNKKVFRIQKNEFFSLQTPILSKEHS